MGGWTRGGARFFRESNSILAIAAATGDNFAICIRAPKPEKPP
jgi:hypothetical protein